MTDETPMLDAWLAGQSHREAFEDMSAAQINALPVSEYARLTGRPALAEAALGALDAEIPGTPRREPASAPEQWPTERQAVDASQLSMSDYARLRGQLGIGRSTSAYGIFGS